MVNVEKVYADHLKEKNVENRKKYEGLTHLFSASSAGTCFRKQYLRTKGLDEIPMEDRVMRLLRLGTIVHEDIQDSLKERFKEDEKDYVLYMEHQIKIPDLGVVGHLDIGLYDKENGSVKVYDIKTCASYKWKMKFGRRPDKNGSVNYNLQLATYTFALAEELKTADTQMSLLWYNKDTSALREEPIDNSWINSALEYWEELNEYLENVNSENGKELIPGSYGVPMMNWECRYCGFKDLYCQGI